MKKVILLDGNSIMFRAYYATAYTGNLMKTSNGLYTNAVYGFINMMNKILSTEDLTHLFVAFDKGKKTFRHQTYSDYKGGRKPMPEEFAMQIPYIKEYLDILNVKRLETDDYEADDLIGTVSNIIKDDVDEVIVISGDKDLLQLVGGNVTVSLTKKGITDLENYTKDNFKELMGFNPNQLIDYKGLIGDSSDNLPGVSGIGPKTAIKLLDEYKTLENLIDNVENLKGKVKENILADKEIALRSKMLATLEVNAKIDVTLNDIALKEVDQVSLRNFYEKLEFQSFIKKMHFVVNEKESVKQDSNIDIIYHINEVDKMIKALNNTKEAFLEVEISEENYHKASILGIGILINNEGYFASKECLNNKELIKALTNPTIDYYTNDSKKTYTSLKYHNINVENIVYDTQLAVYVINPSYVSSDIKNMFEHFIETNLPFSETIYGKKVIYQIEDEIKLANYCLDKCKYMMLAKNIILETIKNNDQEYLYNEVELPLAKVLSDVEMTGFMVNTKKLEEVGMYFNKKMKDAQEEIFKHVGHEFNVASPKQLGVVLFEELCLGKGKKNKTGYVTSADVLENLARFHIVPKLILDYRKYAKLYSTYVVGLLNEVNKKTFKVNTIFKQALTQTGRLSSTEPNIQNIPVRTEEGRIIRSVFIPSTTSNYLVSADYSQIELRILAHASNCKAMLATFNDGFDLHASTASKIYNTNIENVSKEQRRIAKAVNFGIVYGMSDWGLSEELHISVKEASTFISKYFEVFPEIKPYLDSCIKEAKEKGYTTTLYNRRRYMPDINSSNGALRKFSERASMNAPIQGTAADVMKIAMIKVYNALKEKGLNSKIVAQVHDELILDVDFFELDTVTTLLKETMEDAVKLLVNLSVDVEVGKTWDLK